VKEESPRGGSGTLPEPAFASSPVLSALSSPFMQKASSTSPPNPPTSPSPARLAGGEIARIRADEAAARAAQERLAEARRPDYMKRISRADAQSSTDIPGLGIAETPIKGRRIELWGFQETSEESFEERLMAGGYGGYGSTSPERTATSPAPSRALEWATTLTPGPSSTMQEDTSPDKPTDEREARKRRRLEAFRRVHARVNTSLHPVEVEGKGRMLLDVRAEEVSELLEELQSSAAGKRRGGKKRRRGGSGSRSGKTRTVREEANLPRVREGAPLDWPDKEFPWNVRTHERRELEAAEEADRMRWIKRFLDEDSDAASSEDGHQDEDGLPKEPDRAGSPTTHHGGGKMVPLPHRDVVTLQKVFVPSDPADARAALLSKQSVRAVAARRRLQAQPSASGEGDEILCICRGRDDGRELVQCDDCRTWYHLECLGIKNIAELGREEDPWYCHNCVALMNGLSIPEPTFAPVEESPLRRRRDPLFYEALQDSPAIADWRFHPNGLGPTTPKANPSRTAAVEAYTRSSFGSRNGPQTPRNSSATTERIRVYTTPGAEERIFQDDVSPFDPASTPSRGVRVGASVSSVFASPKWQIRVPTTYSPSPFHNGADPGDGDGGEGAPSSGSYRMLLHEDTPVDRSAPRPSVLPSKRGQESPLMGRGGAVRGQPHALESPVPLGRKGKERQGGGRR
jgi:PHD-finger